MGGMVKPPVHLERVVGPPSHPKGEEACDGLRSSRLSTQTTRDLIARLGSACNSLNHRHVDVTLAVGKGRGGVAIGGMTKPPAQLARVVAPPSHPYERGGGVRRLIF